MEFKDFIEKFVGIFDETDASELMPDTKFRDLDEWSSLSVLGLLAMADDDFGVELEAIELRQANTIQDIYELIKSKKGGE